MAGSASTAVSIFVIFRTGVVEVGATAVGLWALLQGLFLFARMADSGVGVNLTRRYALAARTGTSWRGFALAGLVGGTVPVAVASAVALGPIALFAIGRAADDVGERDVWLLCLLCVAFAVLGSAAAILGALCDGGRMVVARNAVLVMASVAATVTSLIALRAVGVLGLGFGYTAGVLVQVLGYTFLLSASGSTADAGDVRAGALLREMWRENAQLMGMAVTRLSLEPTTKFVLSIVAPLSFVAAFDLAMKLSAQARLFLQAGLQPLVAYAARPDSGQTDEGPGAPMTRAHAVLIPLCVVLFCLLAALTPALSWLAYGTVNIDFSRSFCILTLANFVNAAGLTGYFLLAADGEYGRLLRLQSLMAVFAVGGGSAALVLDSKWAALASYASAMAVGGLGTFNVWRKATRRDPRNMHTIVQGGSAVLFILVVFVLVGAVEVDERLIPFTAAAVMMAMFVAAPAAFQLSRALSPKR